METKILQIIPAPTSMSAIYEDAHNENTAHLHPIACLALVELENGDREVWPMISDDMGCFTYASEPDGFLGIDHE